MKLYRQLIQAILERIPNGIAGKAKGLIYYRDDTNKPYIDTGAAAGEGLKEVMVREELAGQASGPYMTARPITPSEGGTSTLAADLAIANVGDILALNAAKDGYDFLPQGGLGGVDNFAWYYVPVATTVTIPDNQVMYLINQIMTVDGTLIVNGQYQQLTLD